MALNSSGRSTFDHGCAGDAAEIKRRSIRGGAVTMAAQAAGVLIHFASTIILARILGPEEYGVMAMVLAITTFAGLFRELGLSSSTIQKDRLSHDQLSTLFWINVSMGALLTLFVAALSPAVGWFYQRPELTLVTLVSSVKFLVGSFSTQQGALLTRQMRFGRKAAATLSGSIVSLLVSVYMALNEMSYWSLVWGALVGSIVTTVMLNSFSGWRPGWPVRGCGIRSMLKYGANITGFEVVNYFHRNLDNVLIGRVWGADALGLYSRAYNLLMFPILNLRGPINAVAFPAMSRLQDQPVLFRSYYRRINALLAFLSMPLTAFLFITSKSVIVLALGEKWLGVVPIFSILAVVGFVQPVASLRGVVLLSLGHGKRYFKWGVINAVVVSAGFLIGVKWGPTGVAVSYCLITYLVLYPSLVYVFRGTPLNPADFFSPIIRPAVASLSAVVACLLIARAVDHSLTSWETLCYGFPAFSLVFLLVFVVIPGGYDELLKMAKMHREIRKTR